MPKRIVYRIGYRGIALLTLGLIWMFTGVGLLLEPRPKMGVPEEHIPQDVRAVVFYLLPGLIAILGGAFKRLDPTGWGLLMLAPAARFLSFALSPVLAALGILAAYPLWWLGCLSMATAMVLIWACAGGLDRPPLRRGEAVGWQ